MPLQLGNMNAQFLERVHYCWLFCLVFYVLQPNSSNLTVYIDNIDYYTDAIKI